MEGKMITLYGINGIGKTTQAELLVKFLQSKGKKASHVKYPIYDLAPEGPFIDRYLRDEDFWSKHELTTEQLQLKYAENRRRFEKSLKDRLGTGEWIIAEDYVGTGIAWGLTWGASLEYLEEINKDLFQPDANILLHGDRFETAVESGHRNEADSERVRICKNFHLLLCDRYGWKRVEANRSIEAVSYDILAIVQSLFPLV